MNARAVSGLWMAKSLFTRFSIHL